jgi:hypothetical protein
MVGHTCSSSTQDDSELEVSLGYIAKPSQKSGKKKKERKKNSGPSEFLEDSALNNKGKQCKNKEKELQENLGAHGSPL